MTKVNNISTHRVKRLAKGGGIHLGIGQTKKIKVGRFSVPLTYFVTFVVLISVIVLLNIHTATMGAKLSHLETKEEEKRMRQNSTTILAVFQGGQKISI